MSQSQKDRKPRPRIGLGFQLFRTVISFVFIPYYLASFFYVSAQHDRWLSGINHIDDYPIRWISGELQWDDVRNRTVRLVQAEGRVISLTCGNPSLPSACIREADISLPMQVSLKMAKFGGTGEYENLILTLRGPQGKEIISELRQRQRFQIESRYLASIDPDDHWRKGLVGGVFLGILNFFLAGLIGRQYASQKLERDQAATSG